MTDTNEPETPPLGAGIDFADPNSPLAPYYASNAGMVITFLLTFSAIIYAYQPLWNTDIWGHVAYGRWIAENGVPAHEPLNPFTDKEQPFGPYSWLAQRGYYALAKIGQSLHPNDELHALQAGAELIRFVHWLAQIGTFFFLWLACRRRTGSVIVANVAVGLLLVALPTMLGIQRPQAFGAFFFSICLWQWSGATRSRASNVAMVLLFALWANIHGSFAIALVFHGLLFVGEQLSLWREQRSLVAVLTGRSFVMGCVFMAACTLATFVNPHGPLLYADMMRLSGHPNIQTITEWRMLEAEQTGAWVVLIVSVLLITACMLLTRRYPIRDIIIFLAFAAWGAYQQRMLVWWFLLFPWLASAYFADLYQVFGFKPSTKPIEYNFRKTVIIAAAIFVGFMMTPWVDLAQTRLVRDPALAFSEGTCWPVAMELNAQGAKRGQYLPQLAKAIRQVFPDGRYTGTIFATETQADILLFTQPADRPVSMFSHAHAFPPDYWQLCREVKAGDPKWRDILREWKVNLIVAEPKYNVGLTNRIRQDPEWQIVLDQQGDESVKDDRGRKVVAIRRQPLLD